MKDEKEFLGEVLGEGCGKYSFPATEGILPVLSSLQSWNPLNTHCPKQETSTSNLPAPLASVPCCLSPGLASLVPSFLPHWRRPSHPSRKKTSTGLRGQKQEHQTKNSNRDPWESTWRGHEGTQPVYTLIERNFLLPNQNQTCPTTQGERMLPYKPNPTDPPCRLRWVTRPGPEVRNPVESLLCSSKLCDIKPHYLSP